MRIAVILMVCTLVVLQVELPGSFAASCGCSCKKELEARKCGEDDVTYYKRIFTVDSSCECSVKEFYEKVFYVYKSESKETYVQRIDTIFGIVYPKLDCRVDSNRKQYLKKYYSYKYAKKSEENDEEYFKRVLKKSSECGSVYKSKVELIKSFVTKVDWSKVKIEETSKEGFTIIKRDSSGNSKSCGCQGKNEKEEKKKNEKNKNLKHVKEAEKQEHDKNKKKAKEQKEYHNKNEKKIEENNLEHKKNVQKAEEQKKEHEANVNKANEQEKEHKQNVEKIEKQNIEHEKNVKQVEQQNTEHNTNVKKANEQEKEHNNNVKKIEEQNIEHGKNVQKIEQQKEEHEENVKKANEQKAEHERNLKKAEEQKIEHDRNVQIIEERKKKHEENVIKWIKAHYKRESNEETDSYYNRICKKTETDKEYVERLTISRSLFPDLDLWYSEKYLTQTREYYSLFYSKEENETEEQYFTRLLKKESYESESHFAKRINLLHVIFPALELWYEEKYYEAYTKIFYQTYYKKEETESNDVYLKRVFTRFEGESEECFWKRIKVIKQTFPDYKCWYEKDSLQKLDACKSISQVNSEEELKKKLSASGGSDECSKAKLECLQTFFRSSKSSQSSQSTSEEQEISYSSGSG